MAELLRCENCPREALFRKRTERIAELREQHRLGATSIMDDEDAKMFTQIMYEKGDLEDPDDIAGMREKINEAFEAYENFQQLLIDMREAEMSVCIGALRVCGTKNNTRVEVTICNSEIAPKIDNVEQAIVERSRIDEF